MSLMRRTNPSAGQSGKILSPRSSVWQFMELNRETRRARCRFCEKILAYTGGTTNLRYHLTAAHAMEEFEVIGPSAKVFKTGKAVRTPTGPKKKQNRKPKKTGPPATPTLDSPLDPLPTTPSTPSSSKVLTAPVETVSVAPEIINTPTKIYKRPSLNTFTPTIKNLCHRPKSEDREMNISFRLLQMLIQSLQPLSFVGSQAFKKYMKFLEPSYQLPEKEVLQNNLLAMYAEAQVKLKETLDRDAKHYALMYDLWKASNQQMYSTVIIHYLTDQWERKSYVLGTEPISDIKSSAVELNSNLQRLMYQYGLRTDHLVAIVSQQGALAAQLSTEDSLLTESLSCAAEKLELCVTAALEIPEVNGLLVRARQLTSYLLHEEEAHRTLEELKVSEGFTLDVALIEDSKTSWITTSDMLFKLLTLRSEIEKVADLDLKNRHVFLDGGEWVLVEKLVISLQILRAALAVMSRERSGSISCLLPVVHSILQHCEDATHAQNSPMEKFVRTIGKETREKWDLTAILPSSVSMIAALLDPRFKKLKFIAEEDKIDVLEALDIVMAQSKEVNGVKQLSNAELREPSPFLCLFGVNEDEPQDKPELDMEVSTYMSSQGLRHDNCPLDWWRVNKGRFPRLAVLARQFLCVPAVVQPESEVSGAPKMAVRRALLEAHCAKQMIFLNHNWDLTLS